MAEAAILIINQATRPAGVAGQSRADGVLGQRVTLRAAPTGDTYDCEILSTVPTSLRPELTRITDTSWHFTPGGDTIQGAQSYRIRLTVDAGTPGEVQATRVFSIRTSAAHLRIPAPGESSDPGCTLATQDDLAVRDRADYNLSAWGAYDDIAALFGRADQAGGGGTQAPDPRVATLASSLAQLDAREAASTANLDARELALQARVQTLEQATTTNCCDEIRPRVTQLEPRVEDLVGRMSAREQWAAQTDTRLTGFDQYGTQISTLTASQSALTTQLAALDAREQTTSQALTQRADQLATQVAQSANQVTILGAQSTRLTTELNRLEDLTGNMNTTLGQVATAQDGLGYRLLDRYIAISGENRARSEKIVGSFYVDPGAYIVELVAGVESGGARVRLRAGAVERFSVVVDENGGGAMETWTLGTDEYRRIYSRMRSQEPVNLGGWVHVSLAPQETNQSVISGLYLRNIK